MALGAETLPLGGSWPAAYPRVTAVMPALNEARNLPYVLSRLPADLYEVILVDGRSNDDTIAVAEAFPRSGKGNALTCGFAHAEGDIIVTLDADGSADPREIPRFVDALLDGADFAKGSRFVPGGGTSDITRFRRYGNRWLNRATNAVHRTRYTDLCYGYNAFWRRCIPALGLDLGGELGFGATRWGDGFEVETLLHIRAAQAGLSVVEVPSFESMRLHGRSNLNAPIDGLRVLRTIVAERWSRRARTRLTNPDYVIDLTEYGESARLQLLQRGPAVPHKSRSRTGATSGEQRSPSGLWPDVTNLA